MLEDCSLTYDEQLPVKAEFVLLGVATLCFLVSTNFGGGCAFLLAET